MVRLDMNTHVMDSRWNFILFCSITIEISPTCSYTSLVHDSCWPRWLWMNSFSITNAYCYVKCHSMNSHVSLTQPLLLSLALWFEIFFYFWFIIMFCIDSGGCFGWCFVVPTCAGLSAEGNFQYVWISNGCSTW